MNKQEKERKYEQELRDLKLLCYEGQANSAHFEEFIATHGLGWEVTAFIVNYYKDDVEKINF